MSRNLALMLAGVTMIMLGLNFWMLGKQLEQQTSALNRIAVAAEQTAANTKTPVAVKIDMVSDDARATLEDALKPQKHRGK